MTCLTAQVERTQNNVAELKLPLRRCVAQGILGHIAWTNFTKMLARILRER
jgi:hypothetical protein